MRKTMSILSILLVVLVAAGWLLTQAGQEEHTETITEKRNDLSVFLPGQEISALFDDGDALWVGGKDGILLLDRLTGESVKTLDAKIEMVYAADICQTQDGTVWAGHSGGLTAFSPEGAELFSFAAPEIPGGRVNALLPDGDGLWIGTERGAACLGPGAGTWRVAETFTTATGLIANHVSCIARVGDALWFGAYLSGQSGGLSIRSPQGWQYLSVDKGLPHRYINAILPLPGGQVLVGTGHLNRGGLAELSRDDGGWQVTRVWNTSQGIPGEKVRQLFQDSENRLWITTESHGLLLCDAVSALDAFSVTGLHLTVESGLSDNEIKCIVETEDCFWLGGRLGLTRMERTKAVMK